MFLLLASREFGHSNLCFLPQVKLKIIKLILVLSSCKKRIQDVWSLNDVQCRFVCCINLSETVLSEGRLEALRRGFQWWVRGGEGGGGRREPLVVNVPLSNATDSAATFLEVLLSLTLCCEASAGRRWAPWAQPHCKGWTKTQRSELYFTASVEILIAIQAPHCLVKV